MVSMSLRMSHTARAICYNLNSADGSQSLLLLAVFGRTRTGQFPFSPKLNIWAGSQ